MFDIWPEHKNVALPSNVLSPLTDRGVNILVVPLERESHRTEPADNRERVILDSLRRNVDVCYAYSKSGHIAESDLQITCSDANLCKWGQRVLESGSSDEGALCEWNEAFVEGSLTQSYRRIDLTTALTHI